MISGDADGRPRPDRRRVRYGIPEFRLPKHIVDHYEIILQKLGVRFKPNTFIGSSITLDDMFIDGYQAVFIAVGTAKPNKLGLLGETLGNVYYAIDYLKSPDAYPRRKKIVVVGAGNVALDAARMAVHCMTPGGTVAIVTIWSLAKGVSSFNPPCLLR